MLIQRLSSNRNGIQEQHLVVTPSGQDVA